MPEAPIDLESARLSRLRRELSSLQAWADEEARRSIVEARWIAMRSYVRQHQDAAADGFRVRLQLQEGAEDVFTELDARLRRGPRGDIGPPRSHYHDLRGWLRTHLAWAAEEREAALDRAAPDALDPATLRSKGRALALARVGARLGQLLAHTPSLPRAV